MKKLILVLSVVFLTMSSFTVEVDCVAAAIAAGDLAEALGSSDAEAHQAADDVYEACTSGGTVTLTIED